MTPADVAALFTRADGTFRFARWDRALAPVVFGTDDASLVPIRAAMEEAAALTGTPLADTDPELGANLMVFFCAEWAALAAEPRIARLIPGLDALTARLSGLGANQYRLFSFDAAGAIRAVAVLLRQDADLAAIPARTLILSQTIQSLLLWSDRAFGRVSPLVVGADGIARVRADHAALIRAAYDPVLPAATSDPAFALRLHARMVRPS